MAQDMFELMKDQIIQDRVFPPFRIEVGLQNGKAFSLQSLSEFLEPSGIVMLRIWDFRAMSDDDIELLRRNLNQDIDDRRPNEWHPKLDWGALYVPRQESVYCVAWHNRDWPEADVQTRNSIGFRHQAT